MTSAEVTNVLTALVITVVLVAVVVLCTGEYDD